MISLRIITGSELQLQTPTPRMLLVEYIILAGISAVYLVAVEEYNPLVVVTGELVLDAVTVVWYWYTEGFDPAAEPTS